MNSPHDRPEDTPDEPDKSRTPNRILTANDLYNINGEVTGRMPFVRDYQVLRSTVARPYIVVFGEEQFPSLIDKAAATMHALAAHHVFADGNKRTAVIATRLFLQANGIQPTWTEDEVQHFTLLIAKNEANLDSVRAWLAEHTA
jgi:death-on-curing protein